MSLITCIECGKIFSDKAMACPICACPTVYILKHYDDLNLSTNEFLSNDDVFVECGGANLKEKVLNMTVEDLNLSIRSYGCLKRGQINTIRDLTEKTYDQLLMIKNMGKKSIEEVISKLNSLGLQLKEIELQDVSLNCSDGNAEAVFESTNNNDGIFECHCASCDKVFIPAAMHIYKERDFYNDRDKFYCSFSCFNKRNDRYCPVCGKKFVITYDAFDYITSAYDFERDVHYCSQECLKIADEE